MTPSECTLFLHGPGINNLCMLQETLKIVPGKGQSLYRPLRTISAILITGELQQGLPALLMCARSNIPVGFFSMRGELTALLEPAHFKSEPLADFINELTPESPETRLLNHWLQEQQRHEYARLGLPAKSRLQQQQIFHQQIAVWLRQQPVAKKQWHLARNWLEGLIVFYIRSSLHQCQIEPHTFGCKQLSEGLADILRPVLLVRLSQLCLQDMKSDDSRFLQNGLYKLTSDIYQSLQRLLYALESEFNRGVFYGNQSPLSDKL